MDNREGKGSNMMESWRVTSENRLQKKTQLQPMLEAGKMTDKGVALSDFRYYRNISYGWERQIFRPMEQPWFLQQRGSRRPGLSRSDISDWGVQCHSLKGKLVTPSLSSFI